jgi:hypothetical protein
MTPTVKRAEAKPDGVNFNYIPLTREEQSARFALFCELHGPRESWDPAVCAELRKQEEDALPIIAALEVMFGKGRADLRLYLLLAARYDARAQRELGRCLVAAATATNPRELEAFTEAKKAIARADQIGPRNRAQAMAFLFAVAFLVYGYPLPRRSEVYDFLASNGVAITEAFKGNAGRQIFNIPILCDCPIGKPGRPRVGSKKWRAGVSKKVVPDF